MFGMPKYGVQDNETLRRLREMPTEQLVQGGDEQPVQGGDVMQNAAIDRPTGEVQSDDELDAERQRVEQESRSSQLKQYSDSYGVGSAIADALLKRAGFGMPIAEYKKTKTQHLQDQWKQDDAASAESSKAQKEKFTKDLYNAISDVADPSSRFYGQVDRMIPYINNDPHMQRNLGMQGKFQATPTGEIDPETDLPIYDVTDLDSQTGQPYSQTKMTAAQAVNQFLGAVDPSIQKEIFDGVSKTASNLSYKKRLFKELKDKDPEFKKIAGMDNEAERELSTYKKLLERKEKGDPALQELSNIDIAELSFNKRFGERYSPLSNNLEVGPDGKTMGFWMKDKLNDNKTTHIPVDGLTLDTINKIERKQTSDKAYATRSGALQADKDMGVPLDKDKEYYDVGGKKVTKAEYTGLKDRAKFLEDSLAEAKTTDPLKSLLDDDEKKTPVSPEEVIKFDELYNKPKFQNILKAAEKGNASAVADLQQILKNENLAKFESLFVKPKATIGR